MGENHSGIDLQNRISFLWDSFVNAENKSYEKGVWLDVFLAEFLAQINDGKNVTEVVSFSNNSAVSTLVACELLSDVHEICSRLNARDNDDLAVLRRHLLTGRGWRCLAVIHCLGPLDFPCAKELAGLLVSLYSLEDKDESNIGLPTFPNPYVVCMQNKLKNGSNRDDIFVRMRVRTKERRKSRTPQHHGLLDNSPPSRYRKVSNASVNRRSLNLDQDVSGNKDASSESELPDNNDINGNRNSNESNSSLHRVATNKNLKIRLNPMDFDYFTSAVRSENDLRLNSESYVPGESKRQKIRKVLPEDFYDDRINNVFNAKLSVIELKYLIVDLLKNLTACENFNTVASVNNSAALADKSVSVQTLSFSLDSLCRYVQCSDSSYSTDCVEQLKFNLIGLLLCSLEKLLQLPDITSIILQKGVIPFMKRLLEDVLQKYNRTNGEGNGNSNVFSDFVGPPAFSKDVEFIYSLLYGSITLLHCLLLQNGSAEKLNQFLLLFNQFNANKLIDRCMILLMSESSRSIDDRDNECSHLGHCKKIVRSIGHLISALKKIRSKIVHVKNCKRARHKNCTPTNVLHHHDTMLGNVFNNSVLSDNNCCVSTLFMILTKFLSGSVRKDMMLYVMHVMMTCGTCCCFPSDRFVMSLIQVVEKSDYRMRSVALILLERTYYRQFGALHQSSSCDTCFKKDLLSNSCAKSDESGEEREKKTILCVFRDLLLSEDSNVSYSVGSHLLRVTPKCNLTIQKEMLFTVFYPAFIIAKNQYLDSEKKNEKNKYVLTTCLSAFTNLLSRVKFTEEFLNMNALKHIEQLLFDPDLIRSCCSIIEIAVIVQIWKWEHCGVGEKTHPNVDDLEMFLDHVRSATVALLKCVNEHNELSSVTTSTCSSFVSVSNDLSVQEGIEMSESFINETSTVEDVGMPMADSSKSDPLKCDHAVFSDVEKWETFSELLENCSVLWRTCANITLYSPQLRKYFSQHIISKYCYDLLLKTLDGIAKHTSIDGATSSASRKNKISHNCYNFSLNESYAEKFYNANQITLKLFESLLVLNLISPAIDEKTDQLMTEETLLSVLRSTLLKTLASGHVNTRHLCDVLLRACCIVPSNHLVLPTHKMPKVGIMESALRDNNSDMSPPSSFYYNYMNADTDGVISGNEVSSTSAGDVLPDDMGTGDEGYEADVEIIEHHSVSEKMSDEDGEEDAMSACMRSLPCSRKISAIGNSDGKRDLIVVHPGLCTVTVHLLAHSLQMHEFSSEDELSRCLSDTVYCLQRLAALCQESSDNCRLLCEHNLLYQLLTQFKPFLITASPSFTGLQHAILNVVTRLAEYSIEPKDLSQFLNLFTEDNPPLESLISALVNIVTSIKVEPNYVMRFPTNNLMSQNPAPFNNHDPAEKLAVTMRQQHNEAKIDSCWSCSSVILGINQELGWSMWASGFSLSLWLCIDKTHYHTSTAGSHLSSYNPNTLDDSDQYSDNIIHLESEDKDDTQKNNRESISAASSATGLLHIVSIGYDLLTMEFWIDNFTNTMIIRLVRSDGGGVQEILAEASITSQLSPGLWHHMAISVRDSFHKRKVCIEVTVLIDGWSESRVALSFTGLLVRKSRPYCVAVGHHVNNYDLASPCSTNSRCVGQWLLGNLMMFRSAVFNKETATYLSALGPDHAHLTETDVGNTRPNFSRLFSARSLSSGIVWSQLLNDHMTVAKTLQENLLLVYSAKTPNTVRLYPQISSSPASGIVGSLLNSHPASGFRVVTIDKRSSQHLPMCITPAVNCFPCIVRTRTLSAAVNTIGGISVFLFLFARIVEMESNEETQARALFLLLKLVQSSAEFNSEFVSQQQHKLLILIISSKKCRPGLHMLKAILDTACDRPGLLVYHPGTGQFQITAKSTAVLVNPGLIAGPVLSAWRYWEQRSSPHASANGACLNMLLQSLLVLLREDHPQHDFNAAQLNRVDTVDILLKTCKERFMINEPAYPALDEDTGKRLVELIAALMSSPPQTEHIVSIVRFLIISHPAHATYVTHMRSSFYFLLPTVPSVKHSICQQQQQNHNKNESTIEVINNARLNVLSRSSLNRINKMKNNGKNLMPVVSSLVNLESKFNFPVDPVELNKALTKLKVNRNQDDSMENDLQDEHYRNQRSIELFGDVKQKTMPNKRRFSKTSSTDSVGANSSGGDSLDGNGCDSGIAGSFKDNINVDPTKHNGQDNLTDPSQEARSKENGFIIPPKVVRMSSSSISNSSAYEIKEQIRPRTPTANENPLSKEDDNLDDNVVYCTDQTAFENGDHKSQDGSDNNIAIVAEGLLLLLRDFILVLPDSKAEQVLNSIMKIEVLIVMANHPSPRVRVAVIKLLTLYLERATEEELARFLRLKGFHLVANQLHSQKPNHELVGCVAALITGQHWLHIDDQIPLSSTNPESSTYALSPLQLSAIPALLAVIEKTVYNPPLTHAIILFLGRFFTKVNQAYKPLLELGIVEVLLKTLLVIVHSESIPAEVDSNDIWQRLLVSDIHNTLVAILNRALYTPGSYNMKVISDLFLLLNYLERVEQRCCGSIGKCVFALRSCHCMLMGNALHTIHNLIHQALQSLPSRIRTTATAFLTSVFSNSYEQSGSFNESVKSNYNSSRRMSWSNNPYDKSTPTSSSSASSPSSQCPSTLQFTQSELCDRFEMIMVKAVELIVNDIPIDGCYSQFNIFGLDFVDDLLTTLLNSVSCIIDRKSAPRTSWTSIMWSSRETIKSQTGKLLVWLLSPGQINKIRVSVVNKIRNEQKSKEVFLFVFENNQQLSEQFLLYLWDLINGSLCSMLQPNELKDCEELNQRLHDWGFVLPQERPGICCDEDVSLLWDRTLIEQKAWWKQQERCASRIISRMESVVKCVNESALSITKLVTDEQNNERKLVMETLKNDLSDHVHTQILWKNIIRQLTHERAVWHFPRSYPRSWQLDPTEGPGRIRNRLQRCHMMVSKKYLKPEFYDRAEASELPRPLSYLFNKEGEGQVSSMSALLIEKLHTDKKIRHMVTAQVVTPAQSVPGELLIGETCLYFVPSSEGTMKELNSSCNDFFFSSQAWQLDEIKEVHTRRFQLKERALEIFLLNGRTYLLAFESSSDRDKFQAELCQCDLPNRVAGDHLSDAIQLWREGLLTNWEYLTILNKMAGRSYNDLMQYPVMPFILADYTSRVLDLTDGNSYRNLEKPMAVQDKKNEQHYINNYNYLKQEMELSGTNQGSYHYGSHYSNSGVVLHFLVRLPPFTSMFLTYQDDNFDLPDRTFHSLDTTWRLTSRESTTDVKELIPEFFFLPEFLTNQEGFDFGVRQNGEKVDYVTLPPWAENDPRKFTLIHRQALESDFVRENIPHWIDLVFGYKQTGKAAVDAVNVFHPATYCGFDVESIEDPLERCAWETMVRTYGQTPRQLFKTPHPMCVQSLIINKTSSSTHCNVKGIQWGTYVGSPTEPSPTIVYKHQHRLPVISLIPLLTNDVFGLAPSTTLLLTYSKSKSLTLISPTTGNSSTSSVSGANNGNLCVHGAAIVFWGHADGVLRVKMKRDLPPCPIARPPGSSWDVITRCTSAPDTNQLWIGYSSGRILVYKYQFVTGQNNVEFSTEPYILTGHTSPILSISLSHNFSVALTGCQDGVSILWDMNCLSYIRSLPNISMPVNLTFISETTGDLITVGHDSDNATSTLRLHSINVSLLGSITTHQRITAVCFSTASEGVSVNVIATGMEDGSIKFWSTWDLSPVGTDLVASAGDNPLPIICLMYSYDSHHLYASLPSGHVVIWESRFANTTGKQPKFLNLSNLSL